jgi:hypothetical protein
MLVAAGALVVVKAFPSSHPLSNGQSFLTGRGFKPVGLNPYYGLDRWFVRLYLFFAGKL